MFESLIRIFDLTLYQPLFNFLVLLYNYLPGRDFGVAVIVLTLIIRLVLYPSSAKSIKTQKILNEIQPKIKEIQKKYKDDKEKQVKETMGLYKQAKINPFSGFLSTFIQLPLLIALYRVFWRGFQTEELVNLYSFVPNPGFINATFLGMIDLSKPNIILAVLAGALQFVQTKTMLAKNKGATDKTSGFAKTMQKQMVFFFPFLTIIILLRLPSALGLYWVIGSLFLITEQYIINKKRIAKETKI
ncbi:YidC/Oxa1 family membrane protein insertase [Patescibacteria group bacterium]|nr:YidC/Oxa1 family membrane protein insertase [Patescibacteria group bacterium]MBU4274361.1 YidC/Oxa1 family membrane protein insertase [Patescibacteria group bacterium]MBU4367531.1 YidC/Oxa1 family membrane protein insertase [Patescibacteria group bacterium]MBU4461572.1 YidC/Oxa1 family membrane protein insertase [Patescibacteria group bacterium]MCG2699469.1 YidC/Oxa1 family membrane protein insertase [Candidatus Parcubacteria bacterium]